MFTYIQHIISLVILYLYPSYRSYKALDSKNIVDAQEWLCYWIVAGILTVPLLISNSILNWLPFYYEIKLLFCLWLIFPKTKGHLYLFNKYVIPNMDKFSGRIDTYSRDITEMSKKYAGVAWQKGLEIAQTKFFEVITKGPSALLDFSNISFNLGNTKNSDDGRIREINDDDELLNSDNKFSEYNYDGKSRGVDISNSNQIVLKKKRSSTNSNIKKFSIGLNRSNSINNNDLNNNKKLNKKRSKNIKRMDNEYDIIDKRDLQRTPSFRKTGVNKKRSYSNRQPYISRYSDSNDSDSDNYEGEIYNDENSNDNIKSTKPTRKGSSNSLFMNMMSNQRPGPGGMMSINDVYSSESDHSNSNDGNYYEDEDIEENYNYNKNNVYYGSEPRKKLSRTSQHSMRDNYYDYDYDYDLNRHDDETVTSSDSYDFDNYQRKKANPKIVNDNKKPELNYQQSYISNFNSFFH